MSEPLRLPTVNSILVPPSLNKYRDTEDTLELSTTCPSHSFNVVIGV